MRVFYFMNLGSFTTPLTTSSLKSTVKTARPTTMTTQSAETRSPTITTRTTKSETTTRATDVPTSRQATTAPTTQKSTTTQRPTTATQRPTTKTTKTTAQKPKPNYTTEVKIEKVTVVPTTRANVPPTTKKTQSSGNKNKFSDYPISSGLSESGNKLSSSSAQKRIDLFNFILCQFSLFNLLYVFYDCYV